MFAGLADGLPGQRNPRDEFEFLELMNSGAETLNLSGVRFVRSGGEGIEFDFSTSNLRTLAPGERIETGLKVGNQGRALGTAQQANTRNGAGQGGHAEHAEGQAQAGRAGGGHREQEEDAD